MFLLDPSTGSHFNLILERPAKGEPQLSNPKAAIIYASVFATFLPADFSFSLAVGTVVTLFIIEAGWYTLVALVLSSANPRAAYLQVKKSIDRCAGGVMCRYSAQGELLSAEAWSGALIR